MAVLRFALVLIPLCYSNSLLAEAPDPITLLKKVASARQNVASGEIELTVIQKRDDPPKHGVDRIRLSIVFDGTNRRCDEYKRELVIDGSGVDGGSARREKLEALQGDREAFVKLGLGYWQEAHVCSIYDGSRVFQFDGSSTTVSDPGGTAEYIFDPRILGLTGSFSVDESVDYCLALKDAQTVSLLGKEEVQGTPSWHVRVVPKSDDEQRHFWIDSERGDRVLRYQRLRPSIGSEVLVQSEYAEDRNDPLPTKIGVTDVHDGQRTWLRTFLRTRVEYRVRTDPTWWTLAGLNMSVGAPVTDIRIHQRIGYWNGAGLSKELPKGTARQRLVPPQHSGALLDTALKHAKSDLALDAVSWIIANTPDGPDVDKAGEILLRDHIKDERLGVLGEQLRGSRSKITEPILREILKSNPHDRTRALACFSLASNLKEESERAASALSDGTSYAKEAGALFERILSEYADVEHSDGPLGQLARPELNELRTLWIGSLAPEIDGHDCDGHRFKLSDYRGRVVVLTFSANWCSACVAMYPQLRSLIERYKDQPFAVVSVSGDAESGTLQKSVEDRTITWRCWWDGPDREISEDWNVASWPAVYVLDADGVIRFKNVRGDYLEKAVATLMSTVK